MNFPLKPWSDGQQFTSFGISYRYDAATSLWKKTTVDASSQYSYSFNSFDDSWIVTTDAVAAPKGSTAVVYFGEYLRTGTPTTGNVDDATFDVNYSVHTSQDPATFTDAALILADPGTYTITADQSFKLDGWLTGGGAHGNNNGNGVGGSSGGGTVVFNDAVLPADTYTVVIPADTTTAAEAGGDATMYNSGGTMVAIAKGGLAQAGGTHAGQTNASTRSSVGSVHTAGSLTRYAGGTGGNHQSGGTGGNGRTDWIYDTSGVRSNYSHSGGGAGTGGSATISVYGGGGYSDPLGAIGTDSNKYGAAGGSGYGNPGKGSQGVAVFVFGAATFTVNNDFWMKGGATGNGSVTNGSYNNDGPWVKIT